VNECNPLLIHQL